MSWSNDFLALLGSSPVQLAWAIEVATMGTGTTIGTPGIIAATYPAQGMATILETPAIRGQSVSIQDWRHSPASAEVRLQLLDSQAVASALHRGSYIRILAGSEAWDVGRFQPIMIGVLANIQSPDGVTLILEIWDLLTALTSTVSMFGNAGTLTALAAAYTVGDATIDLVDASLFEFETGGSGVVKLGVVPFYLTYTGKVGNQLTGVSAGGQFGTTAANTLIGFPAYGVVYLSGHPLTITRRLLASTGLGTNGTADVYPASWGFGIPAEDIDDDDIYDVRTTVVVPSAGNHSWDVLLEAPVEVPFEWWADLLSRAGIWVCNRQGQITARAVQSTRPGEVLLYGYLCMKDANIIGAPSVEWYDSRVGGRYTSVVFSTASSSVPPYVDTSGYLVYWPCSSTITYDLSSVILSNESNIRTEVLGRLKYWCTTSPEAVDVTMVGCIWAAACPGDIVQLDSANARGRLQTTYDGYSMRDAMIVDVEPDFQGGATKLRLSILPDSLEDEWGQT